MKNNKGITLIALVVTIIVLLILAGVSIAMLTGQNGILNRASQSATQSAVGNTKDLVAMKVAESITEFYAQNYTNATGDAENADVDAYIASQLTSIAIDSDVTVTVSGTGLAVGATAGTASAAVPENKSLSDKYYPTSTTGDAITITIASKSDSTVKTVCTWTDGGKFSSWTDSF
jgi:Tfp pilus assembly protein PilE